MLNNGLRYQLLRKNMSLLTLAVLTITSTVIMFAVLVIGSLSSKDEEARQDPAHELCSILALGAV